MKLLVTLPALNEEKSIKVVIEKIPNKIDHISVVDVLVLNDGSSDNTASYAIQAGARVISLKHNMGLGFIFQKGVEEAIKGDYDIMVNIDADGQFNPHDIVKLIMPIINEEASFVTASRFIDKELIPKMPGMKKWGNKMVAHLISYISGKKYYDVSCGFRAYSKEALLNLNLFSKFTYTHETFLNLSFKDLIIHEVPIEVRGEREFGNSKMASSLWKYGYNIFNTIFRTALDYKPLKFFGWGGILLFVAGLILDIFIGGRFLITGLVTPYKTIGFVGLFLNVFGLMLLIVGLLADMINKVRLTQERLLYFWKKNESKEKRKKD
ncbi:MAG: glycosyltransferase [Candidatus Kerfeldbacteria bacterium]